MFFAAFAVSRGVSKRDFAMLNFWMAFAYLVIGVGAEKVLGTFGAIGGEYRFMGTLHPEGQGFNCGVLCLASLALADTSKGWRRIAFATVATIGFIFLVLTGSRGPFVGFVIACAGYT